MKTENLVIMKELLKRLENMTPEEYENFQPEGLAVARAISSNDYVQDNSFEMVLSGFDLRFEGIDDVYLLPKEADNPMPDNDSISSKSYPTAA